MGRHTCTDPDHCPRCEAEYEARAEREIDADGAMADLEADRYERYLDRMWEW